LASRPTPAASGCPQQAGNLLMDPDERIVKDPGPSAPG